MGLASCPLLGAAIQEEKYCEYKFHSSHPVTLPSCCQVGIHRRPSSSLGINLQATLTVEPSIGAKSFSREDCAHFWCHKIAVFSRCIAKHLLCIRTVCLE